MNKDYVLDICFGDYVKEELVSNTTTMTSMAYRTAVAHSQTGEIDRPRRATHCEYCQCKIGKRDITCGQCGAPCP